MFKQYLSSPFICLCFLLLTSFTAHSQGIVTASFTDDKSTPLPGVVTELRRSADSVLVKVNVTDAEGHVQFSNIPDGRYYIKASLLSFTPYRSGEFPVEGGTAVTLPAVSLNSQAVTLKAATVTGIKPLVEVHADKTVFNVENSINATGSTAYELLQKSPGVVVDNNDNILLKGRSGVLVQIDGKDSRLTQQELGDYLRSLQSTDVEAIELISNPSSKYDAEGTAGIINIRLKKNKNYGTNGSVTLGYALGEYSKYNTAISLNNRSKKVSVFANYSNNWGKRLNEFYLYREQYPYIFDAANEFTRWGLNHNYKAGVDYTLNARHTLGVMVNGNNQDINGSNINRNQIKDFETQQTDSILQSDQTVEGFTKNINYNLNHRYADTTGHSLVTDFDIGYYSSSRDVLQPNVYTLPDGETVLSSNLNRTVSPTTIHIYTLKSDYTQPLLKGKLGAGYKLSFVNTDNTFSFYDIEGGNEIIDSTRSNHFDYTENIFAGYLNYQHSIDKIDIQAGLRVESTNSEGDLVSAADTVENKNVKRQYTDYFPSAGLTLNMSENNSFSVVYSTRIDRPDYGELNPFVFKLDELSYRQGNPFLNPQYSDKIEISHTYKGSTTTSLGYSNTEDFVAQITDTFPGGKSVLSPKNLATEKVLSLDISSSFQPFKWLGVYFHAGLYNQAYKADFGDNKTIDNSITNFNIYAQNNIRLPAGFSFEISGWYNSKGVWGGAYVNDPQGSLDLGLQKKLFQDQATLKLTFTDVFHTAPWSSENTYAGIVIRAHGSWESQQFRANFTWRFGNRQMKNQRQRATGNESEQQRLGGGD